MSPMLNNLSIGLEGYELLGLEDKQKLRLPKPPFIDLSEPPVQAPCVRF